MGWERGADTLLPRSPHSIDLHLRAYSCQPIAFLKEALHGLYCQPVPAHLSKIQADDFAKYVTNDEDVTPTNRAEW